MCNIVTRKINVAVKLDRSERVSQQKRSWIVLRSKTPDKPLKFLKLLTHLYLHIYEAVERKLV